MSPQRPAFGETGTPEIARVSPKSQSPTPLRCRSQEHADMAKNITRRPVSLKAKSSWIIDGSTRYVAATAGIGDTGTPGDFLDVAEVPWTHAIEMPSPKACGQGQEYT